MQKIERKKVLIIRDGLTQELFDRLKLLFTVSTDDSRGFESRLAAINPDVIIVDFDLIDGDGIEICDAIMASKFRKVPLIFVDSLGEETTIIDLTRRGVSAWIAKSFDKLPEYIMAVVDGGALRSGSGTITVKDIEIDLGEHKVMKNGKRVDLTYIQFKLLYLLASRREQVFSRKEILEKVWGKEAYVTNHTIDVHIKRLREKLGEYKYPSQYIETIHGTGYRFL